MTVTVCSGIFHTSGVSLYTFRSWLVLNLFLSKFIFPNDLKLVLPPKTENGPFGFNGRFEDLLEIESLQELATTGNFSVESYQSTAKQCLLTASTIRIGISITRGARRIGPTDSGSLHQEQTIKYEGDLKMFIHKIGSYIHKQIQINDNIQVLFPLYKYRGNPLSHASSVLEKERQLVDKIVKFKHVKLKQSSAYQECGYAYVRKPIVQDLIFGGNGSGDGVYRTFRMSTHKYVQFLHKSIKNVTKCIRINAIGDTRILEKNLKLFKMSYTLASVKKHIQKDILEREIALNSKILITEQGTHQFDWTLSKRTLSKKPSIMITYVDGIIKKRMCAEYNNFCNNCTNFYETHCAHNFIPQMTPKRPWDDLVK